MSHQNRRPRDQEVQMGEVVDQRVLERELVEGRQEEGDHRPVGHDGHHRRMRHEFDHGVVQHPQEATLGAASRGLQGEGHRGAQGQQDGREVHEQQMLNDVHREDLVVVRRQARLHGHHDEGRAAEERGRPPARPCLPRRDRRRAAATYQAPKATSMASATKLGQSVSQANNRSCSRTGGEMASAGDSGRHRGATRHVGHAGTRRCRRQRRCRGALRDAIAGAARGRTSPRASPSRCTPTPRSARPARAGGPSSARELGAVGLLDGGDAAVAQVAHLVVGERVVDGAEPKSVGEASCAVGDALAPVDVEERQDSSSAPPAPRNVDATADDGHLVVHHERQVDVARREPADAAGPACCGAGHR